MNKIVLRDGSVVYERVSKRTAKKLWEQGKPIVLCPVKLYPFGGFRPSMLLGNTEEHKERGFDTLVRDFEYYNCNLHETGYYAAFYTPCAEEN